MTGKKGRWTKGEKVARKEKLKIEEKPEEKEEILVQSSQLLPVDNKLFQEYYVNQGIVSEDETELFMEHMKKALPISFRFSVDKSNVRELLRVLKRDFLEKLSSADPEGGLLKPLTNIPWLPNETVWQLVLDDASVAGNESLKDFTRFLYQETECGNLIQQDVAGMLPGLLLNIKPDHKVLDLRASPGHRTMQLIELLHSNENIPDPDGIVVANETHLKRCFSLSEQIRRYFSPNFAIVNMDANNLPSLYLTEEKDPEPFLYDRIVCGFPSSGDGLFRNNIDGLRCWTANVPLSHHAHLTQMLYSGLSSLAIGGQLVFSIYSMNPIEAEAVVYAVIMQQRGTVELKDIAEEMPDLVYEKGLHSWRVMAKGPRWFREYEEVPEHLQNQIWPSMFPPTKEEAERVGLEKCVRILPHKKDTVGLFIAVFKRTSSLYEAWQREQEEQQKAYEAALEESKRLEEEKKLEEKKRLEEKERKKLEAEEKKKEAATKTEEKSLAPEEEKKVENKDEPEAEGETDEGKEKVKEKSCEVLKEEPVSVETVENKEERKEDVMATDEKKLDQITELEAQTTDSEKRSDRENEQRSACEGDCGKKEATIPVAGNYSCWNSSVYPEDDAAVKADADERKSRIEGKFKFLEANDKIWTQLKDFYGISDEFPYKRIACRPTAGIRQHFCFMTDTLKKLVEVNQSIYSFVSVGVKLFTHVMLLNATCPYRLAQEGLSTILPYMTKRIVNVSKKDFAAILSSHSPTLDGLTAKTKKEVTSLENGGFALVLEPDRAKNSYKCRLIVSAWKEDESTYRTFIPTYQRLHYLRIIGSDVKDYDRRPDTEELEFALASIAKSFQS